MLQIGYQITIGSTTYTRDRSRLLTLQTHASLTVPINCCTIALAHSGDFSAALDDTVTVKLGYGDALTPVFSGTVGAIDWGIDRVEIESHSCSQALTTARFNLLYEKSYAGDIVRDVADRLSLKSRTVENGIKFPVYALGDHLTADQHLRVIAQQCGFDFYTDPQDQLAFAQSQSGTPHELEYGTNILSFELAQAASLEGVQVYGESPVSQGQGEQAYAWLTKKAVKGSAGKSTGLVERWLDPTARTQDIASQIAQARLKANRASQRGSVQAIGNAAVTLGDTIRIAKMPTAAHNGSFKVTSVRQSLSRTQGFRTYMDWEEA